MVPLFHPSAATTSVRWRTSFITEFAEGVPQRWGTNNVWKLKPASDVDVKPARFMHQVNINGHDSLKPCPAIESSDATQCQAECDADDGCTGWTHHYNGPKSSNPGWRCCKKSGFVVSDLKSGAPLNTTSGVKDPSAYPLGEPGDLNVHPPAGPADGSGEYIYDTPDNQWRQLRVINATHDISFTEWDKAYVFDTIAFCEYYDIAMDPWQQTNLCQTISDAQRASLHAELEAFYECRGDRTTMSTCP